MPLVLTVMLAALVCSGCECDSLSTKCNAAITITDLLPVKDYWQDDCPDGQYENSSHNVCRVRIMIRQRLQPSAMMEHFHIRSILASVARALTMEECENA
jgi:hypothetical protein